MPKPGPGPEVTAEAILDVFENREDASEPLTASDLADALGCSRRTALNRLNDLAAAGTLEKKEVGARAVVFWITEGKDDPSPAEPLRALTGILDDEEADRVRARTERWREAFDETVGDG